MRYQTALHPDAGILMPAGVFLISDQFFFAAQSMQNFETVTWE
jgi:hypothetical protein